MKETTSIDMRKLLNVNENMDKENYEALESRQVKLAQILMENERKC
jgi:hypothetical protein